MGRWREDGESSGNSVLECRVLSEVETGAKNDGFIKNNGGHAIETEISCIEGKSEVIVEAMENNDGSVIEVKNSSEEVNSEEIEASLNEGLVENNVGSVIETKVNFEVEKTEVIVVEKVENYNRSAPEPKNSSEEGKIEEIDVYSEGKAGLSTESMFSCEGGERKKNVEIEDNGSDAVVDGRVFSEEEKTEKTDCFCSDNGESMGAMKGGEFHYGERERERFNVILKRYVGTHNFHNFTTRTKAEDPSARRYILSFNADDVVTIDGMEFVRCKVVGQSFMLHQIRKMIGLAVAVMRSCAPESLMETALKK